MDPFFLDRRRLILLAVLVEGGLGVLACLGGWFFNIPLWEKVSGDAVDAGLGFAACLPMALAFFICLYRPYGPLASIEKFASEVIVPLFSRCTWYDLAVICMLAGFGEEMMFRGLVQMGLGHRWGPVPGMLAASVLFGLFHPVTPAYAVLAGFFGMFLGLIVLFRDNLMGAMIAHGVYDFLALMYLVRIRGKRGNPPVI